MVDPDRRKVLQVALAAAAVPFVPGAVTAEAFEPTVAAAGRDEPAGAPELLGSAAGPGPLALLAPWALGAEVGLGWTLSDLRAPERGAMLLVLSREGQSARVHVCANPGCPAGIASTDRLDFILMNGGSGDGASDEELGRVLRRIAAIAATNEATCDLSGLLPHEQRIARWLEAEPGALL